MNGIRILALFLTTIKLLMTVTPLFCAACMLDMGNNGSLIALIILLGVIGLGYPFYLIRTKRFVMQVIVIFSAIPFCSTFILLPIGDLDSWA